MSVRKVKDIKIGYCKLFWIFFKMGSLLLGGGYVILPLMTSELCDKYKLIERIDLVNYFTLSQCFPGIIAVNMVCFVGYHLKKTIGSLICTIAICLPAFLAIVVIAKFISDFAFIKSSHFWQSLFINLNIAVGILVLMSTKEMFINCIGKKIQCCYRTIFVIFMTIFALIFLKISPFMLIFIGLILGIIESIIRKK